MGQLIRRHALTSFFLLAFATSWGVWLPALVGWQSLDRPGGVPWWLVLAEVVGACGPTAAAVIVTGLVGGRPSLRALLRKLRVWRAGARWYLLVLAGPPAALALAIGLYALAGRPLGQFNLGNWPLVLGLPLLALPFGPVGEELGWRGYALPILQRRHTALSGGIILGTLWALWRVPLCCAPAVTGRASASHVPLGCYLMLAIGLTILMNWVFNNTRGSVPVAVLFHTMLTAGTLLPLFPDLSGRAIDRITALSAYPVCVSAVLVVALFGARRLVRGVPPLPRMPEPRHPWRGAAV